jgi:phenylalanyl-tRNA synthetase beta chain
VGGGLDRSQRLRRRVADALVGAGLHELQTITLVERDEPERYGLDDDDPRRALVTLANPLTAEYAALRTSLIPSLLRAVHSNRAVGRRDVHVFETSHTYHPRPGELLPHEPWRVGAVLAGRLGGSGWHGAGPEADAFVAKAVLEVLLGRLGVQATYEPVRRGHLDPGRAARVLVGGDEVGELGELHPRTAERFDLTGRVAVFELDLDVLLAHVATLHQAPAVPDLPPVRQDIAVVVADDVPAARVLDVAREAGGRLLREAVVFDVYRDAERLGPRRVSLAVRLTFRADDRTLTEDEASAARVAVVEALRDQLGAELRGS